jgi:hypothetical protein
VRATSTDVHKEVKRMKKVLVGMGALLLVGALGTGCEPVSKVREAAQRADAAANRAETAAGRAEAGVGRAEAACEACAMKGMRK